MRPTLLLTTLLSALTAVDACKCKKVSNPGLYCGYCPQVTDNDDHPWSVFECSKSGACSRYAGSSSKCAVENPNIYCDGRDHWKREAEAVE
jgi:hypothetical protein